MCKKSVHISLCSFVGPERTGVFRSGCYGADVLGGGAAAASGYVDKSLFKHAADSICHLLRSFGVASRSVGKACVGVYTYIIRCSPGQCFYVRIHGVSSEAAVKPTLTGCA